MFLYRNLLLQAWKITWKSKYLWFFGLFAALLGNGGELEIFFHNFDGDFSQNLIIWPHLPPNFFSLHTLANIGRLLVNDPISLIFALGVFLAAVFLACFLIWLVVVSQTALVYNSAKIIMGKKHGFISGLKTGMKKFWPVFGLNAIVKLIIYIFYILISLPIIAGIAQADFTAGGLLFIVSFLLVIPLAIILSFIVKYAIAYVVIKGCYFIDAIQLSWKLFVKNWLVSVEMAFILFFINCLAGLGLIFLSLILAIPFFFLALIFYKLTLFFNFWLIIVLAFVLFLFLIASVGAGLAIFQTSSWTGLFLELIGGGGISKITRIFKKS